jgi:hypothetical protein
MDEKYANLKLSVPSSGINVLLHVSTTQGRSKT